MREKYVRPIALGTFHALNKYHLLLLLTVDVFDELVFICAWAYFIFFNELFIFLS